LYDDDRIIAPKENIFPSPIFQMESENCMGIPCIVMFSGGLDSTIVVHLLKEQGLDVTALHFVLPFDEDVSSKRNKIQAYADALGVPVRFENDGAPFLEMMKNPQFGFGKNANPCLDCRIRRLIKAKQIMEEIGAKFIATGEVLGQRPMSQRKDCLDIVIRETKLKGFLLRPLSAKFLLPTIPEEQGWVKRELLLGISGRGRHEQLAYAATYGLKHGTPAGGCILTYEHAARRLEDLQKHGKDFSFTDLQLIAVGRHFRLSPPYKIIIGRDQAENVVLDKQIMDSDYRLEMADKLGPLGLGRGEPEPTDLMTAGAILARYSRSRAEPLVKISVTYKGEQTVLEVKPASESECDALRI
jgi:tRNA-uridine 2-sulfurtransferase